LAYLKRIMSQLQQHWPQWMLHITNYNAADIDLGSDCQDNLAVFWPLWSDQYYLVILNTHALGFKT
jgi:hypothetical protein